MNESEDKSKFNWRTAGGIAALCLVLIASAAVLWNRRAVPSPDVRSASSQVVAAFLADARFAQLTSTERQVYLASLADRYARMNAEQQAEFDGFCKEANVPRQFKVRLRQNLAVSLARKLVGQYQQMSSQERGKFLDEVYAFYSESPLFKGESDQWFSGRDSLQSLSPKGGGLQNAIQSYQQIVGASTDAGERALMIEISRGLSERWKLAQSKR